MASSLKSWLLCFFGHARDPLTIVVRNKMHHECRRCQEDMGAVLVKPLVVKPKVVLPFDQRVVG